MLVRLHSFESALCAGFYEFFFPPPTPLSFSLCIAFQTSFRPFGSSLIHQESASYKCNERSVFVYYQLGGIVRFNPTLFHPLLYSRLKSKPFPLFSYTLRAFRCGEATDNFTLCSCDPINGRLFLSTFITLAPRLLYSSFRVS